MMAALAVVGSQPERAGRVKTVDRAPRARSARSGTQEISHAGALGGDRAAAGRLRRGGQAGDRRRRHHRRPGRRRAGGRRARPRRRPARHAEPAQPRVPAGDGGPRRAPRAGRGFVLVLAHGDVPLPRADRPGRAARHRIAVRRDARGRLHRGRRVPLPASPGRWERLRRPGGAVLGDPGGAAGERHRPDPSAGAVHGRAASAAAPEPGSAASCTTSIALRT